MALTLDDIVAAVERHRPQRISSLAAPRRAAVAALLREGEGGSPEVLLMQRSRRPGDSWSGHVSFPGGREEERDASLLETAIRETREEVAVDLKRHAELVGALDAIRARGRSGLTNMSVWPYVFVATEPIAPRRSDEAEEVFWLPLDLAASGRLDSVYPYRVGPVPLKLPCWEYDGRVVWGMTYRMLEGLLGLVR